MVLFNYSTKELTAKIVYYGPGLCGKTTNLEFIYESLPEDKRGRMLSLSTQTDRTLYFDFLPVELGDIRGMTTRVQLYTVPGQVFYDETRRMVLKGVDGVVFVADSQVAMADANLESFQNLQDNLKAHGLDLAEMPMVLQFNKRDLPDIQPVDQMNAALNRYNAPFYEAVATTGIGVHDTLKAISKLVLRSLTERYEGGSAGRPAEADPRREESPAAPAAGAAPTPAGAGEDATPVSHETEMESAGDDWECSDLESELDQMDATEIQGLLEEVDGFDAFDQEAEATTEFAAAPPETRSAPAAPQDEARPLEGAGDDDLFSTPPAEAQSHHPEADDGSVWMGAPEGEETDLIPGESADLEAALAAEETADEEVEFAAPEDDLPTPEPATEDHPAFQQEAVPEAQPALDPSLTFENFLEQKPSEAAAAATPPDVEPEVAMPVLEANDGPALVPGVPEQAGNGDLRVPLHLQLGGREHTYILTLSLQAADKEQA